MYLIITRDQLLFTAIACLTAPDNTVRIQCADDICPRQHLHARVIIDTFRNNILYTSLSAQLKEIRPGYICILSPFGIKGCFPGIPVKFIPRNISVRDFHYMVIQGNPVTPPLPLFFSHRHHEAVSLLLQMKKPRDVMQEMNISKKTLSTYTYHTMSLLNLRKFSRLLTHRFAGYFLNDTTSEPEKK